MSQIDQISVFLPAYNEEANLRSTIENVTTNLKKNFAVWELIVVNDGSKDNTEKVVKSIMKTNPHVRMITHSPNRGYGGALKTGLYESKYRYIGFSDSDGQFDLSEITKFTPYFPEYDMVIGYRAHRADPLPRKVLAFMLKIWNYFWFQFMVKDTDCAFKVFKKEVVEKIPSLKTESAITTTEFLIKVKQAGFKIKEVPVTHLERVGGKSTGGNPKVILRAARETIKLWYVLKILGK